MQPLERTCAHCARTFVPWTDGASRKLCAACFNPQPVEPTDLTGSAKRIDFSPFS